MNATNGLPALKRQFVYGNYLDEPLAMDVNGSTTEDGCVGGTGDARYFYLQNTLYSVVGLVNASGALVEAYAYDPYGRHWRITRAGNPIASFSASTLTFALGASSSLGNPYLFTGQRFDPETGLHYYKNRYYDCGLGRFVSTDPTGLFESNYSFEEPQEVLKSRIQPVATGSRFKYRKMNEAFPFTKQTSLYEYAASKPSSANDPIGLDVYLIDGNGVDQLVGQCHMSVCAEDSKLKNAFCYSFGIVDKGWFGLGGLKHKWLGFKGTSINSDFRFVFSLRYEKGDERARMGPFRRG